MVINFLGDSITEGCAADCPEHIYSAICCSLLDAKEGNYGLGGSRIARQRVNVNNNPDEDFLLRARWMNPCDFLFVFGGTNDYGHGDAPLGKIEDSTPWTFYGALNCLCEYLLNSKNLKKEQICFILPTYRHDESNPHGDGSLYFLEKKPLERYRMAISEVCSKFGIDTLRIESLPKPLDNKPNEYYADGLHPTTKGHRLIGKEVASYLRKKGH
jgi:lysophospholipase L1-like esterase